MYYVVSNHRVSVNQQKSIIQRIVPAENPKYPGEPSENMYQLTIATPEKVYYEDQIDSLTAPGSEGYLGILSHHAPLITTLQPGKVSVRDSNKKVIVFAVSGGFLEVSQNKAMLLADAVELAREIDIERASRALKRAQERLREKQPAIDLGRALSALNRAKNRINIYEEFKSV